MYECGTLFYAQTRTIGRVAINTVKYTRSGLRSGCEGAAGSGDLAAAVVPCVTTVTNSPRAKSMAASGPQRLAHLDGLRGVAILAVIFFHFFERWPAFYPYGSALVMPLRAVTAEAGVWLFFVISGFVITLTLHRCVNFTEFFIRRFARLWPPMLLCAGISYLVLTAVPASPFPVSPRNFLPSLTFIDPYVYDVIFHRGDFDWMDGAYWSLFVEVQFYALISFVYFLNPTRFTRNFLLVSAAVVLAAPCAGFLSLRKLDAVIETSKLPEYLPFFVIGVGFYKAHCAQSARPLFALGLCGLLVELTVANRADVTEILLASAIVLAIAWFGIATAPGRRILSATWISAIGVASYSLYLLHQRIGITIIHGAAKELHFYGPGSLILAVGTGAVLILASMLVFRYWEAPLNRSIVARMSSVAENRKRSSAAAEVSRSST